VTRPVLDNLPPQGLSFVGRVDELNRLDRLVRDHRLVTIAGLGGMGKTRLALQCAGAAIGAYPGGVWFVSLKEIDDPSRIPNAAAEAVGLDQENESDRGALFEQLWKARALLIFDNAEHLIGALAAFVRELLEATLDVHVIVTSRETLQVEGEQILWLGGIDDGVRLFTERAYPAHPHVQLPAHVINAVANICAKLQGIPLAIELAAAAAATVPPEKLIDTIDRLPASDALVERMVDWSYHLLRPAERRCFDAVALFEATFSWEAAEAIACPADENAHALLDSLVSKSLVVSVRTNRSTEYYLLEVVREYARQRLAKPAPGEPDYTRRYIDYYLDYVESLTSAGIDEARMLAGVSKEWTNIQGALRLAMDEPASRQRTRGIIAKLWRVWLATGRLREGLYWIGRALETRDLPDGDRVELLDAAARMAAAAQNYPELEPLAAQLVAARERDGDSKPLGDALFMLANAKYNLGADGEADLLYQRALAQFEKSGSRRGVALVLGTLGTNVEQRTVVADDERFGQARDLLEQSLTIFREEAVVLSCAQVLENLGVLCMRAGDLRAALSYTTESLALYRQNGNSVRAALAHVSIADVHLAAGDPLRAISELQAGRSASDERPHGPFVPYYAESGFKGAVDLGVFETAAKLYAFAREYRNVIRMPLRPGEQAAMAPCLAALRQAIDARNLEQLFVDGASMDLGAVDALMGELKGRDATSNADNERNRAPDVRRPKFQRERVSLRIDQSANYPAVFVTASGAWGKTIAVDHYLAGKRRDALRLRLGPAPPNLDEFLALFRRAIGRSLPSGANLRDASPDELPAEILLEWLSDYRGAIVVDDLHVAENEPRIAQLLFDVVSRTTERIAWFLLSRHAGQAPIGTCIAYGLTDQPIDERDLRFTIDDAMGYARLLRANATQQECEAIVEFTNGWPFAMNLAMQAQLAAIAMAPLERRAHVERETVSLSSFYLRESVFAPMPADERRMLLTTSAMPGDIRIDVMRQLDPAAGRMLSRLSNLVPMVSVTDSAYRMPQLFKQCVRIELDRSPEREEIRRALAEAYERIGDPISAIKVLLDMEQYDAVIGVLAEHTQAWANADWPDLLETLVARLPAQVLETNPTVLLARAAVADRRNRFDLAMRLLERAYENAGPGARIPIACAKAALCINNDEPVSAAPLENAIEQSGSDAATELRARALLCCAYLDERRGEGARALLARVTQAIDELVVDETNIDIVYVSALAHYRLEDYAAAKRLALRITAGGHSHQPWLVVAQADTLLSQIAAQTGAAFEEIIRYGDAAIVIAQRLNDTRYHTSCLQRRCTLLFYSGRLELIEHAMNQRDTSGTELWRTYSTIFRFFTELQQAANAETMEKATASYSNALLVAKTLPTDVVLAKDPFIPATCLIMTSCLANDLTIGSTLEQMLADATAVLDQHASVPPATRRHATIARLTAILCQVFLGEHLPLAQLTGYLEKQSNDVIADAVASIVRGIIYTVRTTKSSPQRSRRGDAPPTAAKIYAELAAGGYGAIATLLAGLARRSNSLVASGVALSKTETEILLQMADSLSAADIAAARHLSIDTVRTHMKNLYRKLDVNSAPAALNRARSLGLLSHPRD
jgi:predicted ATPase/ATP/maltotriose-dependent transcriptional regulator MalT